ncbi:MAG TPA: hypothetical protein VGX23_10205 [Actinocrinis sp.]|nr:hypothetical protein [Actinocrinis sp.]
MRVSLSFPGSLRPFARGPLRPRPSHPTPLLPRQSRRDVPGPGPAAARPREAALRYASWGWPVSAGPDGPGTVDLDQVYMLWSRLADAPVLGACGWAFDVVEADGGLGREALARLDRLGAGPGPVVLDPVRPERLGFLVRPGSAGAIRPWVSWAGSTRLYTAGQTYELPGGEPDRRRWLRDPGAGHSGRPVLPAAHLLLGALALAPRRA